MPKPDGNRTFKKGNGKFMDALKNHTSHVEETIESTAAGTLDTTLSALPQDTMDWTLGNATLNNTCNTTMKVTVEQPGKE